MKRTGPGGFAAPDVQPTYNSQTGGWDVSKSQSLAEVPRQNFELWRNHTVESSRVGGGCRCENGALPRLLTLLPTSAIGLPRSRCNLLLENLALRQKLAATTSREDPLRAWKRRHFTSPPLAIAALQSARVPENRRMVTNRVSVSPSYLSGPARSI